MTDHDGDQLGRWLNLGPDRGPTATLEEALARVASIRQRAAWMVALGGGTVAARPIDRRLRLTLVAAVALLAIVAGGLFVGGAIDPAPDPTNGVVPSPTTEGTPSTAPAADVIVFNETKELAFGEEDCSSRFCFRSWVAIANTDGTAQRRLFPDGPSTQHLAAVSPDGNQVIVRGVVEGGFDDQNPPYYLTDLRGSEPVVLDTRCALPCVADSIGNFAFSPDGTRIAFVRRLTDVPGMIEGTSSVIAVMDLQTEEARELVSTFASNPHLGMPCGFACGEGADEAPRWSSDGRQLLFTRSSIGIPNQPRKVLDTALFVVDADGSNLRQLVPTELFARDAQWSPDGTLIVFTSAIETLSLDDLGLLENWHQLNDVYTVRPDGTDVRRLTTFTAGPVPERPGDVGATLPTWTADGRITFTRRPDHDPADDVPPSWEVWTMDADGGNATLLDPADAATLTELGCTECAYPFPDPYNYPAFGFWRPMP